MSNNRVSKWDNIKCLLIILVAVGHFANQFTDDYSLMRMVSIFIYSFHMPLFIFMSGLLSRKINKNAAFQWDKPVYFIMIGYLLKIITYLIKAAFRQDPIFELFGDDKLPWYMFAMAAFMAINYALRKIDWKIILPASVLLACLAGYVPWIGSFLYISRILVFFPFYYLGYILNPQKVMEFTKKFWVKASSVGILLLAGYLSVAKIGEVYPWIRMFTGRNAYEFIHIEGCGFYHRVIFYVIALMMGLAIVSLVPERYHAGVSRIGRNTLQIYFWHRLVLYVIMYSGAAEFLRMTCPKTWMILFLLAAVVLCDILSMQFFALPLDLLKALQYRIKRRIRYVHLLWRYAKLHHGIRNIIRVRIS